MELLIILIIIIVILGCLGCGGASGPFSRSPGKIPPPPIDIGCEKTGSRGGKQ